MGYGVTHRTWDMGHTHTSMRTAHGHVTMSPQRLRRFQPILSMTAAHWSAPVSVAPSTAACIPSIALVSTSPHSFPKEEGSGISKVSPAFITQGGVELAQALMQMF